MLHTLCAICDTDRWDREVYAESLGREAFTRERFSARRTPDRIHYRMVRCGSCGLLRSDPVLPDDELASLYRDSAVTYAAEAVYAGETYAAYLRKFLPLAPGRGRLLEIGCGHGFFLERALALGFEEAWGAEPSREAVEAAPAHLRRRIVNAPFSDGLFPEGTFDVVCGFQVLDHLARPSEALAACRKLLAPGGIALFLQHDARAWTNRVLGERSPIVDVEHVCLYDRRTLPRLFRKNGFRVERVFGVRNRYPVAYWARLAPFPAGLKRALLARLEDSALGRIPLAFNAGNLGIVGRSMPVVQP